MRVIEGRRVHSKSLGGSKTETRVLLVRGKKRTKENKILQRYGVTDMPSRQFNKFLQKRTEKIGLVALPVYDQTIRTVRCQDSREVKTRSTGKSTIRQRSTKT